ncbi:MAG: type VI secretion system-associated protein TagO [Inquilinus sp.]|uniref:type VI secretion system-associated protein TagO n=1 Tax=Inquilinus sp. TaxID=1932117 RepID=UPI003F2E22C1
MLWRFMLVAAVMAPLAAPQAAEFENDLTLCRDTSDTKLRLECYDRVVGKQFPIEKPTPISQEAPAPAPETTSAWHNFTDKDGMSDFENSTWGAFADETISDSTGLKSVKPSLVARCDDNETDVFVNWNRYVTTGGIDNDQTVTYRIDDKRAIRSDWSMSTDFEATFSRNAIPLLRNMKGAKRIQFATIPYGDGEVRASFDITGIDAVIADVSKRCGWKP